MDLKKFFSELKRRNVYKVAITYAIVAWLIVQIGSVVFDAINSPEWVMQALLFFMIIGFPIALILAWALELSPQGMIRTDSEEAVENPYPVSKKKPFTSKIFIGILLLALIGLFIYNRFNNKDLVVTSNVEKSIAVLPFINDSKEEDNLYFCNGIMEGILDHLSKIPDLVVVSRSSVEQFRNDRPSLKKIAKELGVEYLVEGSVQRVNNEVVIFAQLIYAKNDKHLWSKRYQKELIDVFSVQADVAESIGNKLEAIITPNVKQRIEFTPTKDMLAYDYYLKGRDNMTKYLNDRKKIHYKNALLNYEKALQLDSLLAIVYSEKALIYWLDHDILRKKKISPELYEISKLCKKALSINPNLPIAHSLLGISKLIEGDNAGFREEQYKALEINPNFAMAYYFLGMWTMETAIDYKERIKFNQKAVALDPFSIWTPRYYKSLINAYMDLHAFDLAQIYSNKLLEADASLWAYLALVYLRQEKYEEAEKLANENMDYVTMNENLLLAEIEVNYYKNYTRALQLYDIYYDVNPNPGHVDHRRGLAYWLNGEKEIGRDYLERALEEYQYKQKFSSFDYCYDVAGIYATFGDTEKALQLLGSNDCYIGNGLEYYALHDPFFINLWENPSFEEIIQRKKDEKKEIRDRILN